MSRACARALRSRLSSARAVCSGPPGTVADDLQPAEDRVERRAQLVRERGQELVLQAARPGQLLVGGRQPAVAALHLLHHAVERVHERPDFVRRVLGRTERVVVALRNAGRRFRQAAQRHGDHAFEAAGNHHRREQAEDEAACRRQRLHAHPEDKLVEVADARRRSPPAGPRRRPAASPGPRWPASAAVRERVGGTVSVGNVRELREEPATHVVEARDVDVGLGPSASSVSVAPAWSPNASAAVELSATMAACATRSLRTERCTMK